MKKPSGRIVQVGAAKPNDFAASGCQTLAPSDADRQIAPNGWAEPRPWVRVLAIPFGKDKDAAGRGVGDDWILAQLGEDHEGTRYYVTTDRVHASEAQTHHDITDPGPLARAIVEMVNAAVAAKVSR